MPVISGINHLRAVRALEKAGFQITKQGKHITMSNGVVRVHIPRSNPINAVTMGAIVTRVGLTIQQFRELL